MAAPKRSLVPILTTREFITGYSVRVINFQMIPQIALAMGLLLALYRAPCQVDAICGIVDEHWLAYRSLQYWVKPALKITSGENPDRSCPPSSLVSPKSGTGAGVGVGMLSGTGISFIENRTDLLFLGFLVSKLQRFTKAFHVFWKKLLPYYQIPISCFFERY